MNRPSLPVVASLLACVLAAPVRAQFVVPEGTHFHNGSTQPLEDEGDAEDLVLALQRAVAVADADEAAWLVRSLRARPGPDLVPLGPRTRVPAVEKAVRLVLDADLDSLAEPMLRDAREAVARAVADRDLDTLLDHATRGVSLPSAADAAWAAARLLFEEGRWWEAAGLAARSGERSGAAQLIAAADERARAGEVPEPGLGPWRWVGSFPHPLDDDAGIGPTAIVDGRGDEVLLIDVWGIRGLDLVESEVRVTPTFDWFSWGPNILRAEQWLVTLPAPRQWSPVRVGPRLVLPFNVVVDRPRDWRNPRALREARLVSLRLDGEDGPELEWMAGLDRVDAPLDDEDVGSTSFGPPLVSGDRVFVQVFRVGLEAEVSLAAFDLASGRLLFETPLVRGAFVPRFASRQAQIDMEDFDKRGREGTVALRDGVVHACTGFGVVAAVDGVTGRLLHSFRYDRVFPLHKNTFHPAMLFDTGGWQHEPVRVHGERIVVAPSDSRYLYMLAAEPGPGGLLMLEDPIERLDRRQLVSLGGDPASGEPPTVVATRVSAGRSGLVRLGRGGHVIEASAPLPEGESFTGDAVVVGPHVLVPSDRGVRIFVLDDLAWGPGLLPKPREIPAAVAIRPFADGLLGVAPLPEGEAQILLWRDVR